MKSLNKILALLPFGLLMACTAATDRVGTNYYFDAAEGSDSNDGRTPQTAFRTFAPLDSLTINPGDSILLKAGTTFTEPLYFSASGSKEHPVVIGRYGGDGFPHLKGDASALQMVHIFNSENLVIRDLEISNRGERIRPHLSGLFLEVYNYGRAENITIDNLFIHDVYGSLIKGEGIEHPDAGGGQAMMIRNFRDDNTDSIPSWFDGLTVENCLIKDSQRNGIIMWGNWIRSKWRPNLHVVIRNNVLDGVPGDGIVPTACDSALVEYNVMRNCPLTLPSSEACDGIWPFSSDNTVVQYNVVCDHRSQTDGYGFDSDYNCRNSLFQYNLSYNNHGGFLLLCNSGGWPEDWSAGNDGTVVRYNVSINDGIRPHIVADKKPKHFSPVIHITGPTTNSLIEKNIFYIPRKELPEMDRTIVTSDDWRGYADSTAFVHNYIFTEEPNIAFDATKSTRDILEGNRYVGELSFTGNGFERFDGTFGRALWYDPEDENWNRLVKFLSDKTVPLNGREVPVLQIIGYE